MLNLNRTVRDVALEIPAATRVFESLKIDYCCGGDQSLSSACATAGVEPTALESMLQETATSGAKNEAFDLQTASLTELMKYIVDQHHVFTRSEIARLQALLEKVVEAHGSRHPELKEIRKTFQTLADDLAPHMLKEEQILFPYITRLEVATGNGNERPFAPFGTVVNPVRMMMMEHDAVGDILRWMRILSSDYTVPHDACISYQTLYEAMEGFEKDLHQHIHLENNVLFPRAIKLEAAV